MRSSGSRLPASGADMVIRHSLPSARTVRRSTQPVSYTHLDVYKRQVLVRGIPHISWKFLSTTASVLKKTDGILPAILNTLYVIVLTLLIVLPLGVGAAVYLTEYASNPVSYTHLDVYKRQKPYHVEMSIPCSVCTEISENGNLRSDQKGYRCV